MGKLPTLMFWNVVGLGLLAAIDEHLFPIRRVAAEAWGIPMTTPWVAWVLVGVFGLASTVAWEAFGVRGRLATLVNRWRGVPTPQERLGVLFHEAKAMWQRGVDMSNPTRAEMDAYAAEVATWTTNTEEWLRTNFGHGHASKLTFYADYLGDPTFWYSQAPDEHHNWQVRTASYLVRNIEVLMKSEAWRR